MEERFGFQALVSRFASLGFILRFIVQTGRSQLCKKEDIIFFQPQFDFASGNLVAVLKSWRQNCFSQTEGKPGAAGMGGNGSREWERIGAAFWEISKKPFSSARYPRLFPKARRQTFYMFSANTLSGTKRTAKYGRSCYVLPDY